MAATFDASLPSWRDRARLRLGDIDTANALLQDATYDGQYAHQGNDYDKTVLELARALIARYSQMATTYTAEGGAVTMAWRDRLAGWQATVAELEPKVLAATVGGTAGTRLPRRAGEQSSAEYYAGGRQPW